MSVDKRKCPGGTLLSTYDVTPEYVKYSPQYNASTCITSHSSHCVTFESLAFFISNRRPVFVKIKYHRKAAIWYLNGMQFYLC
jgi:hypothetical protein